MPFLTGSRLLVQVGEHGSIFHATDRARHAAKAEESEESSPLRGDFLLTAGDRFDDSVAISLRHLGLTSEGITVPQGQTGPLSVLGLSGSGSISKAEGEWVLDMPISASVHYRAIEEILPFDVQEDRYVPKTESFRGRVSGKLEEITPGTNTELRFKDGATLNLEYLAGGLGWIQNFSVPFQGLSLSLVTKPVGGAEFKLRVRPIGFKLDDNDPSPSGAHTWSDQLNQAVAVWSHCGIRLDVQEFTPLVDPSRKTSPNAYTVRGSKNLEPTTVEIYFTSARMADGGGVAFSCGTSLAAIVVSDQQAGALNLVAHEIGHVLNGLHPTAPPVAGEWNGEQGSVMDPVALIPASVIALGAHSCNCARYAGFEVIK